MKIFSKVLKKFFEKRKLGKVSIFNDICAIENRKVNNMYLFKNKKVVSNRSNFFERKVKTIVEVFVKVGRMNQK
jgi:hypothetical protein